MSERIERRGRLRGLSRADVEEKLRSAIESAGGVEVLRVSRAARAEFLHVHVAPLLEAIDGRAFRFVHRFIIDTLAPHARDGERAAKRADRLRARRKVYARTKKRRPTRPRPTATRPGCAACGSPSELLSGGACVNRSRCARRAIGRGKIAEKSSEANPS